MAIISESWDKVLKNQYDMPYLKSVQDRLATDIRKGLTLCPKPSDIFKAYRSTPFEQVKVLILGQDPYYSPMMADGLAFSALNITPSLDVIFKEIKGSTGQVRTKSNLVDWAEQGVFLLNTVLTTIKGKALAHNAIGWERFTRYTIQRISERKQPLVVMLWGKHAIEYQSLIDGGRHLILKAPHPQSDNYLAQGMGVQSFTRQTFAGCQHFSYCNDYMQSKGLSQIKWGDPV